MADVSLYNQRGIPSIYSVGRGLRLFTEDGTTQDFFPGNAEEITVDLDFANGDMVIEPSKNSMFETVIIPKPHNLIPENIAKDAEIAGIAGDLAGGGVLLEGDFVKYAVYRIDNDNKEIIVYGFAWTKLYEDTGKYEITVPSHCGEYSVVLVSEGLT